MIEDRKYILNRFDKSVQIPDCSHKTDVLSLIKEQRCDILFMNRSNYDSLRKFVINTITLYGTKNKKYKRELLAPPEFSNPQIHTWCENTTRTLMLACLENHLPHLLAIFIDLKTKMSSR